MKTIQLTNYSVSEEGYPQLEEVCKKYGAKKVVLLGGRRALLAASPWIRRALKGSSVQILGEFVYGTECTEKNIDFLLQKEEVQQADVLFAVGGGKAIDTGKIVGLFSDKKVFSFPTICSNCSAATAIGVVYDDFGKLSHYQLAPAPWHMFISTDIIAKAPSLYLWAGIGDGLSKQPEVEFATVDIDLDAVAKMGLALSKSCEQPFLRYGQQALKDCESNQSSRAIQEVALDILVSTGYVSNLTNQPEYYYNSSIAHVFYNVSTLVDRDKQCLHGEVVAFGVMVLHAYAKDLAGLERIGRFNVSINLPVTLEQLGLSKENFDVFEKGAPLTTEWKSAKVHPLSVERFLEAIEEADTFGRELLKK